MMRASVLLLALPLSAWAGTPEIIEAVEAKYAGVQTMTADFKQTTKSTVYGADEAVGKLAIQRPGKMRWNFTGDGKQFVTDGSTMWIYNPADNQVIKYSDVSQQAASADSLLQSLDRISDLFEIELLEDTDKAKRLSLKPKTEDAQFKSIELGLTGDLVVRDVTILDTFDTSTALAFSNVKLDAEVPDATFVFEVPKGAEVISAN